MEPVSIITLIGLISSLTLTILKEFFSARARARERKEKFQMEYNDFLKIIENHLVELKAKSKQDSRSAKDLEDQIDKE